MDLLEIAANAQKESLLTAAAAAVGAAGRGGWSFTGRNAGRSRLVRNMLEKRMVQQRGTRQQMRLFNRTKARRKDDEMTSGIRQKVQGKGQWQKWTTRRLLNVAFKESQDGARSISRSGGGSAGSVQKHRNAMSELTTELTMQKIHGIPACDMTVANLLHDETRMDCAVNTLPCDTYSVLQSHALLAWGSASAPRQEELALPSVALDGNKSEHIDSGLQAQGAELNGFLAKGEKSCFVATTDDAKANTKWFVCTCRRLPPHVLAWHNKCLQHGGGRALNPITKALDIITYLFCIVKQFQSGDVVRGVLKAVDERIEKDLLFNPESMPFDPSHDVYAQELLERTYYSINISSAEMSEEEKSQHAKQDALRRKEGLDLRSSFTHAWWSRKLAHHCTWTDGRPCCASRAEAVTKCKNAFRRPLLRRWGTPALSKFVSVLPSLGVVFLLSSINSLLGDAYLKLRGVSVPESDSDHESDVGEGVDEMAAYRKLSAKRSRKAVDAFSGKSFWEDSLIFMPLASHIYHMHYKLFDYGKKIGSQVPCKALPELCCPSTSLPLSMYLTVWGALVDNSQNQKDMWWLVLHRFGDMAHWPEAFSEKFLFSNLTFLGQVFRRFIFKFLLTWPMKLVRWVTEFKAGSDCRDLGEEFVGLFPCCLEEFFAERLRKKVHVYADLVSYADFLDALFRMMLVTTTHIEDTFGHFRKFVLKCLRPPHIRTLASFHCNAEVTRAHGELRESLNKSRGVTRAMASNASKSRPEWIKKTRASPGESMPNSWNEFVSDAGKSSTYQDMSELRQQWDVLESDEKRKFEKLARNKRARARIAKAFQSSSEEDSDTLVDPNTPWMLGDSEYPLAAGIVKRRREELNCVNKLHARWDKRVGSLVEAKEAFPKIKMKSHCGMNCRYCRNKALEGPHEDVLRSHVSQFLQVLTLLVATKGLPEKKRKALLCVSAAGSDRRALFLECDVLKAPTFTGEFIMCKDSVDGSPLVPPFQVQLLSETFFGQEAPKIRTETELAIEVVQKLVLPNPATSLKFATIDYGVVGSTITASSVEEVDYTALQQRVKAQQEVDAALRLLKKASRGTSANKKAKEGSTGTATKKKDFGFGLSGLQSEVEISSGESTECDSEDVAWAEAETNAKKQEKIMAEYSLRPAHDKFPTLFQRLQATSASSASSSSTEWPTAVILYKLDAGDDKPKEVGKLAYQFKGSPVPKSVHVQCKHNHGSKCCKWVDMKNVPSQAALIEFLALPLVKEFSGKDPADKNLGCVPWKGHKDRKVTQDDNVTIICDPDGKLCLICLNVYRTIGKEGEYKNIGEYIKWVEAEATRHHVFLECRKKYIALYNNKTTAQISRHALTELSNQVQLVYNEVKEAKWLMPRRVFIDLNHYDEAKDGKLIEDDVEEQFINGKAIKGVWKWKDPEGHYTMEESVAKQVVKSATLDDGTCILSASQVQVKEDAAAKHLAVTSKKPSTGVLCIADLLANATNALKDHERPASEEDGEDENDSTEDIEMQVADEPTNDFNDNAFQSLFSSPGKPKPSPAPRNQASTGRSSGTQGGSAAFHLHASPRASPSPPARASLRCSPSPPASAKVLTASEKKKGTGKGRGKPRRQVADLVENVEALEKESAEQMSAQWAIIKSEMVFSETHDLTVDHEAKTFKALQQSRVRNLNAALKKVKAIQATLLQRIGKYQDNEEFKLLMTETNEALATIDNGLKLASLMSLAPNKCAKAELVEVLEELEKKNIQVSQPYLLRQFRAEVDDAVKFGDYTALGLLCSAHQSPVLLKLDPLIGVDEIHNLTTSSLESLFQDLLQKVTANDVKKTGLSHSRLASFLSSISQQSDLAIPANWKPDFNDILYIVNCASFSFQQVEAALAKFPEEVVSVHSGEELRSPLLRTMDLSQSGQIYLEHARSNLATRQEENGNEVVLDEYKQAIKDFEEAPSPATEAASWFQQVLRCVEKGEQCEKLKRLSPSQKSLLRSLSASLETIFCKAVDAHLASCAQKAVESKDENLQAIETNLKESATPWEGVPDFSIDRLAPAMKGRLEKVRDDVISMQVVMKVAKGTGDAIASCRAKRALTESRDAGGLPVIVQLKLACLSGLVRENGMALMQKNLSTAKTAFDCISFGGEAMKASEAKSLKQTLQQLDICFYDGQGGNFDFVESCVLAVEQAAQAGAANGKKAEAAWAAAERTVKLASQQLKTVREDSYVISVVTRATLDACGEAIGKVVEAAGAKTKEVSSKHVQALSTTLATAQFLIDNCPSLDDGDKCVTVLKKNSAKPTSTTAKSLAAVREELLALEKKLEGSRDDAKETNADLLGKCSAAAEKMHQIIQVYTLWVLVLCPTINVESKPGAEFRKSMATIVDGIRDEASKLPDWIPTQLNDRIEGLQTKFPNQFSKRKSAASSDGPSAKKSKHG